MENQNVEQFYKSTDGDIRRAGLLVYQKINDSLRSEFGKRTVQEVVVVSGQNYGSRYYNSEREGS